MEYILRTHNLTKHYKNAIAVNNLNINIKKGDIYGFLGPNGAGKTTTLKMITNLIKPTSGYIELMGERVNLKNYHLFERIGSIISFPSFYPNLTAVENLEIHRRLMGITNKKSIEEVLNLVNLLDVRNQKVKNFSLGMKQRLGIGRTLLHHPEFLILDEPTNGLDPMGIKEIRNFLVDLSKTKKITIIISSHILNEIQQMATTIGIINHGNLIEEIDYKSIQLKNRHNLKVTINNTKKACLILEQNLNIHDYIVSDKHNIKIYEKLDNSDIINKTLIENNLMIKELAFSRDSLEDYFLKLTTQGDNANA